MKITLGFFKGNSFISRVIKFITRGHYSHVGFIFDDKSVIEAWHIGGVRHNKNLLDTHESGTEIDIFEIEISDAETEVLKKFLYDQVGKRYDFKGVFDFITRSTNCDPNSWFCSELVMAAFQEVGINLLVTDPSLVTPVMLSYSPYLKKVSSIVI